MEQKSESLGGQKQNPRRSDVFLTCRVYRSAWPGTSVGSAKRQRCRKNLQSYAISCRPATGKFQHVSHGATAARI